MKRNYFLSSVALMLASIGLCVAAGSAAAAGYGDVTGLVMSYVAGALMATGLLGAIANRR